MKRDDVVIKVTPGKDNPNWDKDLEIEWRMKPNTLQKKIIVKKLKI